ncbi:helix-turn-helix transcriptional regulator [Nesterenkonia haasae]|uniref:helix-turn-helix transcriptional regulator n=1 Tax=Nesterenkonia haasae TaxID=2587813 RepID=UPI001391A394|nr:helix-turn-helix domain-containing protein [Nesterenkonia haasae]NDK31200.1 helix-turn-helix domain-containing protein [Nesterenkonia haasae]
MPGLKLRSTTDIANTYGFPEATLRYWRHCGEGPPSVRIGRRVFYREQDVIDWINNQFDAEVEKRVGA